VIAGAWPIVQQVLCLTSGYGISASAYLWPIRIIMFAALSAGLLCCREIHRLLCEGSHAVLRRWPRIAPVMMTRIWIASWIMTLGLVGGSAYVANSTLNDHSYCVYALMTCSWLLTGSLMFWGRRRWADMQRVKTLFGHGAAAALTLL